MLVVYTKSLFEVKEQAQRGGLYINQIVKDTRRAVQGLINLGLIFVQEYSRDARKG
jgi:hypothetical protein